MDFFQNVLEKDFGYSDGHVIESLRNCSDDLRRARLDLPSPPPDDSELPSKPFGVFVPPTIEQIIGRQSMMVNGDAVVGGMIVIPADGGPVVVPMQYLTAGNHRPSSVSSSSVLDHYETATDGLSSRRFSVRDGRSSVTSLVDEFLDIENDVGDMTAEEDDLHVDNIEVSDNIDDTRAWPWNVSSAGPTSRMLPAPAMRSQPLGSPMSDSEVNRGHSDTEQWPWATSMLYHSSSGPTSRMSPAGRSPLPVSPMSDSVGITVGRNTVGMVSLNQPVSLVSVVSDDDNPSTPTMERPSTHRFVTTVHNGATSDAGVRDFFAPTTEQWLRYVRSSSHAPVASSWTDQHPSNTKYHLHALRSAKDRSRQQYFSSGKVDGKTNALYKSQPNGMPVQVSHLRQSPAVSAPAIGSVWRQNNGWQSSPVTTTPNPSNVNVASNEQPVVNVRSRVMTTSGDQIGSKVIFPSRDVSPRQPPVSQPMLASSANWVYRM